MKELTDKEALQKAARYCSTAEHCISEVSDKLKSWGISDDSSQKIIEYLIKEKFIDETRYCESFIHDKIRYNKWGRLKIEQALWQKRISSDIIKSSLNKISTEETEEYDHILVDIINTRKKTIKATDNYQLKNKLIRFGISRGFEMEKVISVVDKIIKDE